jgi:diguanylate cyclase (GGDEF)-like protein
VAERIRLGVMALEIKDLDGKPVRQVTASLGIACLTPGDERIADLLERSDTALYACKAGGRNQTKIWREDMPTPEEIKQAEEAEKARA